LPCPKVGQGKRPNPRQSGDVPVHVERFGCAADRRIVRSVRNVTDISLVTDHDRAGLIGNELPRLHLGAFDVIE
jgi:hypothetical protein